MTSAPRPAARRAATGLKRGLILDAARQVFEAEGLDGASLRAIAARAGYTPAALYFHFDSKEAIYAEVLEASIARLGAAIAAAADAAPDPARRLGAAGLAFYRHYADNPRDLDLGFYLFRGGMKPKGLGPARDRALNAALAAAFAPIGAAARDLGADAETARHVTVDAFAHAAGLLLLTHTGRIRMFDADGERLMRDYLAARISGLMGGTGCPS